MKLYHGSKELFSIFKSSNRNKLTKWRFEIVNLQNLLSIEYQTSFEEIEMNYSKKILESIYNSKKHILWNDCTISFLEETELGIYHQIKDLKELIEKWKDSDGFFFTDNIEYAKLFGPIIYKVELNFENPKRLSGGIYSVFCKKNSLNRKGLVIDCFYGKEHLPMNNFVDVNVWCVFENSQIQIIDVFEGFKTSFDEE
jgi:hypothetical protein